MVDMAGPEVMKGVLNIDQHLIIALIIIGVAILLLKWYEYVNNRLDRIK
jgi:hypothetical protein